MLTVVSTQVLARAHTLRSCMRHAECCPDFHLREEACCNDWDAEGGVVLAPNLLGDNLHTTETAESATRPAEAAAA